jgi:hypothetical protein
METEAIGALSTVTISAGAQPPSEAELCALCVRRLREWLRAGVHELAARVPA